MYANCMMRVHGLGLLWIDGWRVDADQAYTMFGKQRNGCGCNAGESRIPMVLRRFSISAQQNARWCVKQGVGDMVRFDLCYTGTVDHPACAQIRIEANGVDGNALRVVMGGSIAMGTSVRGQSKAADLNRTFALDFPDRLAIERRVSWLDRDGRRNEGADIPNGVR